MYSVIFPAYSMKLAHRLPQCKFAAFHPDANQAKPNRHALTSR
jgi:hypothetical protein